MKADWPKFSGDSKKFRSWCLAILAQLSIPPWLDLYDTSINYVVSITTNTTLNGKLYDKLLVSLDSQVLQNMMSRKHIRGNGLLLLKELVQTYKPRNVPEAIAAKTGEFWSHTKHLPNETVDSYYNRFHDLLDDIANADEPISTKASIHHFLFTLGSKFESIQNNFRIGLLPPEWQTQDWPTMLALCRDYSNSVNPQGLLIRIHRLIVVCPRLNVPLGTERLSSGFSTLPSISPKWQRLKNCMSENASITLQNHMLLRNGLLKRIVKNVWLRRRMGLLLSQLQVISDISLSRT